MEWEEWADFKLMNGTLFRPRAVVHLLCNLSIWKHLCLIVSRNALDVQDCMIFEL